jgi:agmatine/peptidylarginine deiminase
MGGMPLPDQQDELRNMTSTQRLARFFLLLAWALPTLLAAADAPPTLHRTRMPAEFEPVELVLFQWTPTDFDEEHAEAIREVILAGAQPLVLVDDDAARRFAMRFLVARGALVEKVRFHIIPMNSVWTRDYGPTPVFTGDGMPRAFVDWRFSGNTAHYDFMAPLDDTAPAALASLLDAPRLAAETGEHGLVMEGGDLLTDGLGTAFVSGLLAKLNGGSMEQVERALAHHGGITRVVWLERLPVGPENHVDMYIKVVDEETLLVGQYADGCDGVIERNVQILEALESYYGAPYRIIRIPMPGACVTGDYRSYTNALIVNNRVLMPTYGLPTDSEAEAVYRAVMPGYEVAGIDCREIIQHGGALHCITREIPPRHVVRVTHPRFRSPVRAGEAVTFTAGVWGVSDAGVTLRIGREGGADAVTMPMEFNGDAYAATFVPPQTGQYRYVIEATAGALTGTRPVNAADGGWLPLEVQASPRVPVAREPGP